MGDATVSQFVPRSNMGRIRVFAPEPWPAELQAFDGYLETKHLPGSTRRMRNYQLRRFAVEVNKAPWDVTYGDILENLSSHDWGANSKAAARSALRAFYSWAKKTGRIRRNPAKDVERVRLPHGRPHPVPEDVIAAAIAQAPPREALMIRLGAYLGLRCGEIATVQSGDVVQKIRYVEGVEVVRHWLNVRGKGDKERQVPIKDTDLAVELIAAGGYLFDGQIEGHVSAAYVSRLVSRQLPAPHTAHGLRHRFATTALRSTGNIRAVQMMMGHASVATTMVYTEIDDDDMWGAVAA